MAGAALVGGLAILLLVLEATAPSDPTGRVSSLGSSLARQKSAQASKAGQARYRSRPDLDVPAVKVDVAAHGAALAAQGTAGGYIFLAPKSNGPMIVDDRGNLVWYRPGDISNFRAQKYRGRKVLTWWEAPSGDAETADLRDRQPALQDDPALQGRTRLRRRSARVPPAAQRRRDDHRLSRGQSQPELAGWPPRRCRARLDRAGGRRQDGSRGLGVAQPRPRAAARLLQPGVAAPGRALRLLPHQLGRAHP